MYSTVVTNNITLTVMCCNCSIAHYIYIGFYSTSKTLLKPIISCMYRKAVNLATPRLTKTTSFVISLCLMAHIQYLSSESSSSSTGSSASKFAVAGTWSNLDRFDEDSVLPLLPLSRLLSLTATRSLSSKSLRKSFSRTSSMLSWPTCLQVYWR